MDFLDGIFDVLGGFLSAIEQIIAYLFKLIVVIANFIWQVLQLVATYAVQGLKAVGGFFRHLWDGFFKGIFSKVLEGVTKAAHWLESHLRPVIDFLKKAQKYIDRIYNKYFRPILKALQQVRQVLSILRALHIKWAIKLDSILATVQHDIQSAFQTIRGVLNSAIDILNIIADPTKLLRRPTMILSLRRSIYALIRQVTHLPPGYFIPSRRPGAPSGLGGVSHLFDPSDPKQNPPASYYVGMDAGVQSYDFLNAGEVIGDGAVDDVDALDFFDDDLLADLECTDPAECLLKSITLLTEV